jgi:hypothetical protein
MRVARYGAGRTNQKFYFCKIALEQCEGATDDAHKQAHYEAAVFHLHGAFLALLQELSRFYKLSPQLETTEAIRLALEAKGQVSPEISQLQAVETSDAWLGQLQKTFTEYQLAADPVEPQPEAELPDSLIVRMVTMSEEPVLDIARVQTWYKQLQGLIAEFRQEMVEF